MPLKLLPRSGSWPKDLNYIESKMFCSVHIIWSTAFLWFLGVLTLSLKYFTPMFWWDEYLIPLFTTSETLPVLLLQSPLNFLRLSSSNCTGHEVLPSFLLQTKCDCAIPNLPTPVRVDSHLKPPFLGYKAVSLHALCLFLLFVNYSAATRE